MESTPPSPSDPLKRIEEQTDRVAGLLANLLLVLKRSDQQNANARLQAQAALNEILLGQTQLVAIITTPEGLAGIASRETLDAARKLKRTLTIASTGKDPAANRKRDDEITLVRIPRLRGGSRPVRANRQLVKLAFAIIGMLGGIIAKRHGLPWFW